jgi:membrane protease YdiL (CAAX protease family)
MTKTGKALYMSLAVLIIYLIFSSMIKNALFSVSWFKPDKTIFPIIFYSALVDFIVLVVIFSIVHEIRLYQGCFNDDVIFLGGLSGVFIGFLIAWLLSFFLNLVNGREITNLASNPAMNRTLVVITTLAIIVISREMLYRGFLYQYLSNGFGDKIVTITLPLMITLVANNLARINLIEFINVFLFNVLLCYCFRAFRDLWLSTALALSFYIAAFFTRLPLRELAFLERPNLLTGIERSWFGNQTTVFAGLPLTFILLGIVLLAHVLINHTGMIKANERLVYTRFPVKPSKLSTIRDPYIRFKSVLNSHQ